MCLRETDDESLDSTNFLVEYDDETSQDTRSSEPNGLTQKRSSAASGKIIRFIVVIVFVITTLKNV